MGWSRNGQRKDFYEQKAKFSKWVSKKMDLEKVKH